MKLYKVISDKGECETVATSVKIAIHKVDRVDDSFFRESESVNVKCIGSRRIKVTINDTELAFDCDELTSCSRTVGEALESVCMGARITIEPIDTLIHADAKGKEVEE